MDCQVTKCCFVAHRFATWGATAPVVSGQSRGGMEMHCPPVIANLMDCLLWADEGLPVYEKTMLFSCQSGIAVGIKHVSSINMVS